MERDSCMTSMRVREPRAIVIAERRKENLRLVHEPPERFAVNDAIAVALEARADRILGLGRSPASRIARQRRIRRERRGFARFELFADRA